MNKNSVKGSLILLLTAIIWGAAAVAQSMGMDHVGPFTFNGLRTLMGAAVLLPFILIRDKVRIKKGLTDSLTPQETKAARRLQWKAGIISGIVLFIPSSMQQIGLIETDAGKTGFITALYVVMVPVLGLFIGKKTNLLTWISVAVAVVGMYLLCVTQSFTIAPSDALLIASTLFWGVQILVIDYFAPHVDCIKLAFMEFLVTGVLSLPLMIMEQPVWSDIRACIIPMLYAGVMSCGIAYTLQPVGQKYTHPTVAAIIMSLESVFAVIAGFLILDERLSRREMWGCILMFVAVILSQLAPSENSKEETVSEGQAGDIIGEIDTNLRK